MIVVRGEAITLALPCVYGCGGEVVLHIPSVPNSTGEERQTCGKCGSRMGVQLHLYKRGSKASRDNAKLVGKEVELLAKIETSRDTYEAGSRWTVESRQHGQLWLKAAGGARGVLVRADQIRVVS